MELAGDITIDEKALAEICRAHGIRRLALFGSALRGELRPDSDVDLLVEFDPTRIPGLIGVSQLELELEALIGRRVDLRTKADLSGYFRDEVVKASRPLYDAA